jgi:hypothetical protein
MPGIAKLCTEKTAAVLQEGASTLESEVSRLADDYSVSRALTPQVSTANVPPEVMERSAGARYPSVHVYCERVNNTLKQRFNRFSGTARVVTSVRVSHERWDQVEPQTALLVEAVTNLLEGKRGDWGDGIYYAGGYEATFTPVRQGGKNFLQMASVTFDLDVVRP